MTLLRSLGAAVLVAATFFPRTASAQDAAAAEALFRQGRQLYEEKRYAEACPKFAESYRLDPATGSLLALASCYEADGKLASAWAAYSETLVRARRDGQTERAETARQRAAALEPNLARLTIMLAPGADVPGLQVKRGTVAIGAAALGTPLPVDRGQHVVEASAPGHQTFSARINVTDGARQVITIPKLSADVPGAPMPAPAPLVSPSSPAPAEAPSAAPAPAAPEPAGEKRSSVLRPLGIVAIAGGAVAVGVGSVFGIQAISKNSQSNEGGRCVGDVCDPEGKKLRLDAIDAGNLSTACVVVGGILIGGGIVLFALGGSTKKTVALAPSVGTKEGGMVLGGTF